MIFALPYHICNVFQNHLIVLDILFRLERIDKIVENVDETEESLSRHSKVVVLWQIHQIWQHYVQPELITTILPQQIHNLNTQQFWSHVFAPSQTCKYDFYQDLTYCVVPCLLHFLLSQFLGLSVLLEQLLHSGRFETHPRNFDRLMLSFKKMLDMFNRRRAKWFLLVVQSAHTTHWKSFQNFTLFASIDKKFSSLVCLFLNNHFLLNRSWIIHFLLSFIKNMKKLIENISSSFQFRWKYIMFLNHLYKYL